MMEEEKEINGEVDIDEIKEEEEPWQKNQESN